MSGGNSGKRVCPVCGKQFLQKEKDQRYCGKSCAAKARGWSKQKGTDVKGVCKICGKKLEKGSRRKVYCSDKCARASNAKWHREKYKKKRKICICAWCGETFQANDRNKKYCSEVCKRKGMARYVAEVPKRKAESKEERGEVILVMITGIVPVKREMMPKVGQVYAAVRYCGCGPETVVIPEIGKFGLIVRPGEYRVVKE